MFVKLVPIVQIPAVHNTNCILQSVRLALKYKSKYGPKEVDYVSFCIDVLDVNFPGTKVICRNQESNPGPLYLESVLYC